MPWIEPGEFGRARAAHEDDRAERERMMLEERLAAGWAPAIAVEAHRLQDTLADAVARTGGRGGAVCNETAIGLVGEAHGATFAGWWAESRGLDDRTAALVREAVVAACSMTMLEGYLLGVRCTEDAGAAQPSSQAARIRPAAPAQVWAGIR